MQICAHSLSAVFVVLVTLAQVLKQKSSYIVDRSLIVVAVRYWWKDYDEDLFDEVGEILVLFYSYICTN